MGARNAYTVKLQLTYAPTDIAKLSPDAATYNTASANYRKKQENFKKKTIYTYPTLPKSIKSCGVSGIIIFFGGFSVGFRRVRLGCFFFCLGRTTFRTAPLLTPLFDTLFPRPPQQTRDLTGPNFINFDFDMPVVGLTNTLRAYFTEAAYLRPAHRTTPKQSSSDEKFPDGVFQFISNAIGCYLDTCR